MKDKLEIVLSAWSKVVPYIGFIAFISPEEEEEAEQALYILKELLSELNSPEMVEKVKKNIRAKMFPSHCPDINHCTKAFPCSMCETSKIYAQSAINTIKGE